MVSRECNHAGERGYNHKDRNIDHELFNKWSCNPARPGRSLMWGYLGLESKWDRMVPATRVIERLLSPTMARRYAPEAPDNMPATVAHGLRVYLRGKSMTDPLTSWLCHFSSGVKVSIYKYSFLLTQVASTSASAINTARLIGKPRCQAKLASPQV